MKYYMVSDPFSFEEHESIICEASDRIENVILGANLFSENTNYKYEPYYFKTKMDGPYLIYINDPMKYLKLSDNVPKKGVYRSRSMAIDAVQMAIFMGYKEIYLYGADCDYSPGKWHFVRIYLLIVIQPRKIKRLLHHILFARTLR